MNAVIYARYSSDNQREESIEGQLRECKEFADEEGYYSLRLTQNNMGEPILYPSTDLLPT